MALSDYRPPSKRKKPINYKSICMKAWEKMGYKVVSVESYAGAFKHDLWGFADVMAIQKYHDEEPSILMNLIQVTDRNHYLDHVDKMMENKHIAELLQIGVNIWLYVYRKDDNGKGILSFTVQWGFEGNHSITGETPPERKGK